MFADPQTVTVNSVAQSLPAISRGSESSLYRKDDGAYQLVVSHQFKATRNRFTVRLNAEKIAADPLASANNQVYSTSVYLVMDKPVVGYTNTEIQQIASALVAWCSAANLAKVLGGET